MKFCSITPLKNTDLMYENDYVMLLAHLSQKSELYRQYARFSNKYKIMDNSIIELGSSFSLQSLVKEAIICKVDEIILPDVFEDGSETVKIVKESIEWLRNNNYLGKFKLMAVCHGKGPKEFNETFEALNSIPEIDVIGIPKVTSTWMVSRVQAAENLTKRTNKQIHLLGCWYTLKELAEFKRGTKIRSIDTCLPALLSIYEMDTFDDRNGRRIDLEKDEIDYFRYNDIINEINKFLENVKTISNRHL